MLKYQLVCRHSATNFMPSLRVFLSLALVCTGAGAAEQNVSAPILPHEIVAAYPHDTSAFTQGLAFVNGKLIESTGGYGRSELQLKELPSGAVLRRVRLDPRHFGEGLAVTLDSLVQLTWRSGRALVYDRQLTPRGEFRYSGEGWGLAYDGRRLLMSDGSARIAFRDPQTFAITGSIEVRDRGEPVTSLNELEYAGGLLYANVWRSDRIAVIDPRSGAVRNWLELGELRRRFRKPPGWNPGEHVLNGIAYNADNGHFYVTGKCWPVLFELKLRPPPPAPQRPSS